MLNLQNTILSLGKFHEDGYNSFGENNKLRIVKGALVVIKGELVGGCIG